VVSEWRGAIFILRWQMSAFLFVACEMNPSDIIGDERFTGKRLHILERGASDDE
jgi:hypothetical protein